jgi:hypothetical protein
VGDGIMRLLEAGRFRANLLPVFESLVTIIKREIARQQEIE